MGFIITTIVSLFCVDVLFDGAVSRSIKRIGTYCDTIITNELGSCYRRPQQGTVIMAHVVRDENVVTPSRTHIVV